MLHWILKILGTDLAGLLGILAAMGFFAVLVVVETYIRKYLSMKRRLEYIEENFYLGTENMKDANAAIRHIVG
jgi:hypothetical protein